LLCEYLINTYSIENDLILDNCMGGATTPIACINTNHNCIGIEIMEDNFLTSLTRVEEKRKEKEFDVVISQ